MKTSVWHESRLGVGPDRCTENAGSIRAAVGWADTVNVANITVKDYLRREGAPMFWPQIMQSGLYARVKSLEPRDFVAVFGDPFRRGVGFVDRCQIMRLGRWCVVHEYGGETAIDHKVADEALVGRVLG